MTEELKIEKRGLHNWKNLFRKPTLYEWVILFMLIMALFIAWAYQNDTSLCREVLNNLETMCLRYNAISIQNATNSIKINFSEFNLNFTK